MDKETANRFMELANIVNDSLDSHTEAINDTRQNCGIFFTAIGSLLVRKGICTVDEWTSEIAKAQPLLDQLWESTKQFPSGEA